MQLRGQFNCKLKRDPKTAQSIIRLIAGSFNSRKFCITQVKMKLMNQQLMRLLDPSSMASMALFFVTAKLALVRLTQWQGAQQCSNIEAFCLARSTKSSHCVQLSLTRRSQSASVTAKFTTNASVICCLMQKPTPTACKTTKTCKSLMTPEVVFWSRVCSSMFVTQKKTRLTVFLKVNSIGPSVSTTWTPLLQERTAFLLSTLNPGLDWSPVTRLFTPSST